MKLTLVHLSAGLALAALAAGASAEYRCDSPQTVNDRMACAAAQKGPDALRRYVQSWPQQMSNLQFSDYVDERTLQNWNARKVAAQRESVESTRQVASYSKR